MGVTDSRATDAGSTDGAPTVRPTWRCMTNTMRASVCASVVLCGCVVGTVIALDRVESTVRYAWGEHIAWAAVVVIMLGCGSSSLSTVTYARMRRAFPRHDVPRYWVWAPYATIGAIASMIAVLDMRDYLALLDDCDGTTVLMIGLFSGAWWGVRMDICVAQPCPDTSMTPSQDVFVAPRKHDFTGCTVDVDDEEEEGR